MAEHKQEVEKLKGELEELSEQVSTKQKVLNGIWAVAAVLIGFGQWNDTKELSIQIYEGLLSNFTHSIEYGKLDAIAIGVTQDYLVSHIGKPKVIKPSSIDSKFDYHYYFNDKYFFVAIFDGIRLSGFNLVAIDDDFEPDIPFSPHIMQPNLTIENVNELPQSYLFDQVNLSFYSENQPLDKSGLFLNRVIGYVGYGKGDINQVAPQLDTLYQANVLGTEQEAEQARIQFRKQVTTNYFGLAEFDQKILADALLTRYEYQHLK